MKNSLVVQFYVDMSTQELIIASCCHQEMIKVLSFVNIAR